MTITISWRFVFKLSGRVDTFPLYVCGIRCLLLLLLSHPHVRSTAYSRCLLCLEVGLWEGSSSRMHTDGAHKLLPVVLGLEAERGVKGGGGGEWKKNYMKKVKTHRMRGESWERVLLQKKVWWDCFRKGTFSKSRRPSFNGFMQFCSLMDSTCTTTIP